MFQQFIAFIILIVMTNPASANNNLLRLATTTSTANSGLTDYLLPVFTEESGVVVHVIAVGTGKALRLGREGDVDIVLVHAREAEDQFVAGGFGIDRADVMYNDFIIVGPKSDPAGAADSSTVKQVLERVASKQHPFISRGDDSGTHKRELHLWDSTGNLPTGSWYREVGQGMGKTLQIANEIDGYTMTDRGTWLAYQSKLDITLLFEGDPPLYNPYGIIAVNPELHNGVNYEAASKLIDWITSDRIQQMIGAFKIKGQQLFTPSAK
ncbi:MAG: substrate-binding domain-containing protein [Pseudomonadota bacterium]